mmetsp:Transcript_92796/g.266838  ORF Transcript_92796/g.266838 Transcript_92796/m.266838 type:complete len:286 (+) Transcript_92796:548-1405(+)
MRTGGVDVGSGDASGSAAEAEVNDLHEVLDIPHRVLLKTDDDDVCLGILASMQELAAVQQVEKLSAIDFVEGNMDAEVPVVFVAEPPEDVPGGQEEDALGAVRVDRTVRLLLVWTHHREGLSAACLAIGEARALRTTKDGINDRPDASIIQLLVVDCLVERLVEQEVVFLNIPGEVHLELWLAHHDGAVPTYHNVVLLGLHFLPVHRPLAHDDAEPRIPLPRVRARLACTQAAAASFQEEAGARVHGAGPVDDGIGALRARARVLEIERGRLALPQLRRGAGASW